jgi:hypothetical protein
MWWTREKQQYNKVMVLDDNNSTILNKHAKTLEQQSKLTYNLAQARSKATFCSSPQSSFSSSSLNTNFSSQAAAAKQNNVRTTQTT